MDREFFLGILGSEEGFVLGKIEKCLFKAREEIMIRYLRLLIALTQGKKE